jgi:hypothetical protein
MMTTQDRRCHTSWGPVFGAINDGSIVQSKRGELGIMLEE